MSSSSIPKMIVYEIQTRYVRTPPLPLRGPHIYSCCAFSLKGPAARMGQGYADVLVPPAAGGWLWGGAAPNHPAAPLNDWQLDRHTDEDNANLPQQPAGEVSEEQVWE